MNNLNVSIFVESETQWIESFNIKVGKGYVLMRNLKVLVGTGDFLQIRINVSSVFTINKLCVIYSEKERVEIL
jgi:hypothetical protein